MTLKSNLSTIKEIGSKKGRAKSQLGGGGGTREARSSALVPLGETALGLNFNDDQASSVAGVSGNETKRLATKLLEPDVEVEEAREYHSWVLSFFY